MSVIIDAYNVLHCSHVLPAKWAQVGAVGLCRMIERAGVSHGKAFVVCDGAAPKAELTVVPGATVSQEGLRYDFGRVELVYAGGGKDADSLIERMVDADTSPRHLTVVSNDRRIQRAARRRRAVAMGSETFLRHLASALQGADGPQAHTKPVQEADAEFWLKKFGLADDPPPLADVEGETEHWLREFGFVEEDDD